MMHSLSQSEVADSTLIKGAALVCFVAWGVLVLCVVVELVAWLAGQDRGSAPGRRPLPGVGGAPCCLGAVGVLLGRRARPAEIVNYRSMGTTATVLGAGLAFGAVLALALTLVASVRRRRRDLALLKTLGLTRRPLMAVVAPQPTVAAAIGVVLGVPLGIVLGRWLWKLFAYQVHVVPAPSIPAWPIVFIAVGALVLANLVAATPGRLAARIPTALLLRAE